MADYGDDGELLGVEILEPWDGIDLALIAHRAGFADRVEDVRRALLNVLERKGQREWLQ